MNTCLTCKHWMPHAAAIGAGSCANFRTHILLFSQPPFTTSYKFGCVNHEEGQQTYFSNESKLNHERCRMMLSDESLQCTRS